MEFPTIIAKNVLDRLASYASQQICLAWGAQLELTRLKNTLSTIQLVLQDAEKKQVTNPLITRWLGKLKDVCHDVDDVLDQLEFQKLRKEVQAINNCGSLRREVRQFFSRWNPVVFNFKMGRKVKEIRERLAVIEKDKKEFSLVEVTELAQHHRVPQQVHDERRRTTSRVEASSVIGRDEDKKQIIKHLLNNTDFSSQENVSVVSIVGLGGLGKTTLAKLVYNDSIVAETFETQMWICVSDSFDIQTLIQGISKAANGSIHEGESLDLMEKKLQDTLRGKTFFLVLDDVWDTKAIGITPEKWISLKHLLNVGAIGSKIIITTRNRSVASLVNPLYTHALQGLPHKDCMSLFTTRAFKKGEEQGYQHLIEIGEDIVKKCAGVPLAIATMGSMLYLKRERNQWLGVKDDEMWSIGNDDILPALKLSYDALPPHLKPCFVFCSLFPKDYEFGSSMLVELWAAQGYLKSSKKNEDFQQMAIDYVRELCSRCLVQVEQDLKTIIIFKMHDLVHDLAISVAQVEYSTINKRPSGDLEMVRHVSISEEDLVGEEAEVPDFMLKSRKLRTILIPRHGEMNQRFVKTCISRFKCMRVLDLSWSPFEELPSSFEELPSSIASLIHLRFLNLSSNRKIKRLPNSLCKLLNLEFLAIGGCTRLEKIPKDIWNLINLRILSITTQQTDLPKGIGRLTLLQVLEFSRCVNLKSLGEEIQFLNNLRKFAIDSCDNLESLPPNMKQMTALDTLGLRGCEKLQWMRTEDGPQRLRSLIIENSKMEAFPPWLEDSADTLQSIALFECHKLTTLPELTNFTSLECLSIKDCSKLLVFSQGLHCLTKLSELRIKRCPELSKSCKRQLKGEDWSKVASQAKIELDTDVDTDDEQDEDESNEDAIKDD